MTTCPPSLDSIRALSPSSYTTTDCSSQHFSLGVDVQAGDATYTDDLSDDADSLAGCAPSGAGVSRVRGERGLGWARRELTVVGQLGRVDAGGGALHCGCC